MGIYERDRSYSAIIPCHIGRANAGRGESEQGEAGPATPGSTCRYAGWNVSGI